MTQWQLRRYVLRAGAVEDFVREWREHVLPLRRAAGFDVLGPWLDDEGRFVWIVGHDDLERADAGYYDSDARRAVDPDPARHVQHAEHVGMSDV